MSQEILNCIEIKNYLQEIIDELEVDIEEIIDEYDGSAIDDEDYKTLDDKLTLYKKCFVKFDNKLTFFLLNYK